MLLKSILKFSIFILAFNCKLTLNQERKTVEIEDPIVLNHAEAPNEFSDPEWVERYRQRLDQFLTNRNYQTGIRFASVRIHLYIVRKGIRSITEAKFPGESSNEYFHRLYTGRAPSDPPDTSWDRDSLNIVLVQIGVWVRDVVICEIEDPCSFSIY